MSAMTPYSVMTWLKVFLTNSRGYEPFLRRFAPTARAWRSLAGDALDQIVGEIKRVIERLHEDALVFAVRPNVVIADEQSAEAVHRESCVAQIKPVGRAGLHDGHHRQRPPHGLHRRVDRAEQVGAKRGRGTRLRGIGRG